MTQAADGFVHLIKTESSVVQFLTRNTKKVNPRVSADNSDANGVPTTSLVGACREVSSIRTIDAKMLMPW